MEDIEKAESATSQQRQADSKDRKLSEAQAEAARSPRSGSVPRHVQLDEEDVDERLELEAEDSGERQPSPSPSPSSLGSFRKIVTFEPTDSGNPHNWHWAKKIYVVLISILTVINSTTSSSLAAGISKQLTSYFHLQNQEQVVLPTSIFLVGYVCGPLLWGPLSESFGRKWVMIYAFCGFTIFSMATALAPNFAGLVVFRFFVGVFGSCPIAVVGGTCADVYNDATIRGRAMACFMAATTFGPVTGPVVSGYIGTVSWRWPFWIGLLLAGVSWVPLILVPETFAPIILKTRAKKLRKETGDPNIFAPVELEEKDLRHTITVVLTRPIRMFLFEPIVLFTCLYLSLVYAIFYMFFQSYPIIFQGTYGFNAGQEGLTFIPIGIGAIFACMIYLLYDSFLQRARARNAPWARKEEARRLPLACLAGPFMVISLFWAGWTARRSIHWIAPVLAGIPFGIGYLLIFMALLNYLVDAYEIFAASAMAATSTARSLFGAVLPFAAKPMYTTLGVPWACSLLGFLCLGMCVIPFAFIRYGDRIRASSKFCQYLLQRKEEEEAKKRSGDEEMGGSSGRESLKENLDVEEEKKG